MRKCWIGIDIGSTSVNGAILNKNKNIIKDYYLRHKGQPLKAVIDLFKKISTIIDIKEITSMSVTGSGGKLVAELLGVDFVNEIVARAEANNNFYPEVKTIIEIGGEDSRFILLKFDGSSGKTIISDFAMNTICAAGTGSFLDEQAIRLGIPIEELGKIALQSKHPARIAGRCSVFAKTDMIHLQQRATPTCDIVFGLCYALARNFKAEIAKGRKFHKLVSFQGGVAANIGVVKAFENILGLSSEELIIPSNFATLGAIGAALVGMKKEGAETNFEDLGDIEMRLQPKEIKRTNLQPLGLSRKTFGLLRGNGYQIQERKSIPPVHSYSTQNKVDAYLGVDVGSISTNLVVLDEKGNLLTKKYLMTQGKPIEAVKQGLEEIGKELGDKVIIKGTCITGSGRYMIGDIIGADVVKNEITAQARAAIEIDKNVDTIFEIGGQDSKYVSIKNGVVVDFEMNKVCAAGTGSFLEEQSERLNINIEEEFGQLALSAKNPVQLGERCTVFMGSNIGHYQAHGAGRDDITAGLSYSIVQNYLHAVVRRKKIGNNIFFQGGVAFNKGVCAAFEKVLGKKITVPSNHEVTGAIGCALIARDNTNEKSKFKGFGLIKRKYEVKSFVCEDCPNRCEINKVILEGENPLSYGSRCGKYDIEKKKIEINFPDLFAEREALLSSYFQSTIYNLQSTIKIGIPRALVAFYDFFPFWNAFFTELGFKVVVSDKSNRKIIQDGLENAVSEFCFPVKITHGHVLNLIEKGVDYIFLPTIIDLEREPLTRNTLTCPYVQALPDIIEASLNLRKKDIKICRPVLHYRRGRKHIEKELTKMCKEFNVSNLKIQRAIQRAFENHDKFLQTIKKRGKEILSNLKEDQHAVVIIGRLYNTCDNGINSKIPERLRERNAMAIPIDYLPLGKVDISKEWPDMYWQHGIKILKAAKFINENKNLYAVYLTNFGCGPDSFILSFFSRTMSNKPYLEIELDEHSADVGVITRCEAFLESLQNIKNKKYQISITADPPIKHLKVNDKQQTNRTLYMPRYTGTTIVVNSIFRAQGIKSEILPEPDKENFRIGRKFMLGKECLACTISTADIIKKVQSKGFDPEKSDFFTPGFGGPCRVGQYLPLQKMIINEISTSYVPFSTDDFIDKSIDIKDMNKFNRLVYGGIFAFDIINKALHETRPYEINKGETDRAYKKCIEKICRAAEKGGNLIDVMKESRKTFEKIKVNREQKRLIIGLTGQIFYIYDKLANNDIVKKLEKLGVEVWTPTAVEPSLYYLFAIKYIYQLKKEYWRVVKSSIFSKFLKYKMDKLMKPWKGFLKNYEQPTIEELLKCNTPYLDPSVLIETTLSIGRTIDYIKKGVNGTILLMSFSCMPGAINDAIIGKRLREDFGNFPFLSISYDALEETNIQTRLEAFVYQVGEYKKIQSNKK